MHKITTIILLLVAAPSFNSQVNGQNWDIALLDNINGNSNPFLKGYSTFISESTTVIALAPSVTMGVVALASRNDRLLKDALYIGSSMLVDGVLTYGLKASIGRSRPYKTYPDLIEPYKFMSSRSMPSGHTSLAFASATALSLKYPKWYVIAPSYFWACSVGYSRMHLGVHYPSDVLVGAALGAGSAYATMLLNNWFWKKKENKKLLTLQYYR